MSSKKGALPSLLSPMTHGWQIVSVGMLMTAVGMVNFDITDWLFYYRSSFAAPLTANGQAFYYVIFPTLFYLAMFGLTLWFGRTNLFHPVWFMYFFIGLVLVAPFVAAQFTLPQAKDFVWEMTTFLGVVTSVGMSWVVVRHLRRLKR